MRAWLIILAITSFTLAGTTVYFAHELSVEREARIAQAPAPVATHVPEVPAPATPAPQSPSVGAGVVERAPPPPSAAIREVAADVAMAGNMSPEDIRKLQEQHARQFLEQLSTREGREDIVAQHKLMFRNVYPRIERVLGLTPDEHSRFLEMLANQQIEMQENQMRCTLDPACDPRTLWNTAGDPRQAMINDFLGPERSEKYATYMNTMGEREAVSQLRSRLPDAQRLSDDSAESLIVALAAERDAMSREDMGRGGMAGYGFGAGMIMSSGDTFEERYESAKRNSQRLRDRAAQYLSAEQLRVFNEMQDETLVSLRAMLRNKDSMSYSAVAVPVTQ
jgi:hypothetical protein